MRRRRGPRRPRVDGGALGGLTLAGTVREPNPGTLYWIACLAILVVACSSPAPSPWSAVDVPPVAQDAMVGFDGGPSDRDAIAMPDRAAEASDAPAQSDQPVEGGVDGMCGLRSGAALRLPGDDVRTELSGPSLVASSGCAASTAGAEVVHPLTLAARTGVVLSASAGLFRLSLSVRRDCAVASSEFLCDAQSFGDMPASLRAILEPGRYVVVVDAVFPSPFPIGADIRLRTFAPAPNATCDAALPLLPTEPRLAQDTSGGLPPEGSCGVEGAAQLHYTVTVPAFHRAVVTAVPRAGSAGSPWIGVADGCSTLECLAGSRATAEGGASVLTVDHRGDAPRTLALHVSAARAGDEARFDLSVRFVPLPRHADCALAMPVSPAAAVIAQDLDLAAQPPDTQVCGRFAPRALYYAVTVAAGQRLRATATPAGAASASVALDLVGTCGARSCEVNAPLPSDAPRVLTYRNGAAPRTVVLAVSGDGTFDLAVELFEPAPNASCSTPRAMPGGSRLAGEQMLRSGDGPGTCYGTSGTYPELYYAVSLPPGHSARVRATPVGPVRWDLALRVLSGCGATTCPVTAAAGGLGAPETLSYTNRDPTTREVAFAVTSLGFPGEFDLEVDTAPPPSGAQCATAARVTTAAPALAQDITAGVDSLASACLPSATGPTLYYAVAVPAGTVLSATVTPYGLWNPAVRLLDGCAARACAANADLGFVAQPETLRLPNPTATARDVILAVSATASVTRGTFDLRVATPPARPNASCVGATALADGARLVGEDLAVAVQPPTGCLLTGGAVLHYAATVPPNASLRVRVTPTGPVPWDPVLRVLPSCEAAACALSRNGALAGQPEEVLYPNRGAAPESVVVTVGSADARAPQGTFDLEANVLSSASNAACASAAPLAPGSALSGQDVSRGTDDRSGSCVPTATGPTLYYALSVPARSRAEVTARHDASPTWIPTLRALRSCDATSCLAFADTTAAGDDRVLSVPNFGDSALGAVLAVSSVRPGVGGPITLAVRNVPLAPNARCSTALALANGTELTSQDLAGTVDPPSGCATGGDRGNVLHYAARVPGGSTLIVRAVPRGPAPWTPLVRIQPACLTGPCLAVYGSAPPGFEQSVAYAPSTAQDVAVEVGPDGAASGPFDLRSAIVPSPTNVTCAAATAIAASGLVRDQVARGTESLASACVPTHSGGTVYYRVTVPVGATLRASVTTTGAPTWSPVVRVLLSCAASACLASGLFPASPATYTNPGSGPADVIVAVSAERPGQWGAFDLTVDLRP